MEADAAALLIDFYQQVSDAGRGSRALDVLREPLWQAGDLLANAWGPALAASFDRGDDVGYHTAERDMSRRWSAMARAVRAVSKMPTSNELKRRRGESTP